MVGQTQKEGMKAVTYGGEMEIRVNMQKTGIEEFNIKGT